MQGACIPPVFASADKACFCGDARLSPLSAGDSSPCALAGCAAGAAGIGGIQEWYRGFCGAANAVPPGGGAGTPTQTPNPNQPAQPVAPVETTQPDGSVVTVTPAPNPTSTDGAVRNPVKQSWYLPPLSSPLPIIYLY